jgi:hypothetical protein
MLRAGARAILASPFRSRSQIARVGLSSHHRETYKHPGCGTISKKHQLVYQLPYRRRFVGPSRRGP